MVPGMLSEMPTTFPRTAGQDYLRMGQTAHSLFLAATDGDLFLDPDSVSAVQRCDLGGSLGGSLGCGLGGRELGRWGR